MLKLLYDLDGTIQQKRQIIPDRHFLSQAKLLLSIYGFSGYEDLFEIEKP